MTSLEVRKKTEALRQLYQSKIERCNVKLDKILILDWVPQPDKEIAIEIRNEEVKALRMEFMKKWEEIHTEKGGEISG